MESRSRVKVWGLGNAERFQLTVSRAAGCGRVPAGQEAGRWQGGGSWPVVTVAVEWQKASDRGSDSVQAVSDWPCEHWEYADFCGLVFICTAGPERTARASPRRLAGQQF